MSFRFQLTPPLAGVVGDTQKRRSQISPPSVSVNLDAITFFFSSTRIDRKCYRLPKNVNLAEVLRRTGAWQSRLVGFSPWSLMERNFLELSATLFTLPRGMSIFGEVFHVERRRWLECHAERLEDIEHKNTYRMFAIFRPGRNWPKLAIATIQK